MFVFTSVFTHSAAPVSAIFLIRSLMLSIAGILLKPRSLIETPFQIAFQMARACCAQLQP
jgi:hypothetical protein